MDKVEGGLNILRAVCGKPLRPTGDNVVLAPNTNVKPQVPLYSKRKPNPKRPELANPTVEEAEEIIDGLLAYNNESTTVVNID